jgi:hypothetical protein
VVLTSWLLEIKSVHSIYRNLSHTWVSEYTRCMNITWVFLIKSWIVYIFFSCWIWWGIGVAIFLTDNRCLLVRSPRSKYDGQQQRWDGLYTPRPTALQKRSPGQITAGAHRASSGANEAESLRYEQSWRMDLQWANILLHVYIYTHGSKKWEGLKLYTRRALDISFTRGHFSGSFAANELRYFETGMQATTKKKRSSSLFFPFIKDI